MKVVYTEEALRNLDDISDYIRQNYPTISETFRLRLQFVVARIAKWPESAQEVADQSGVRVVPLVRYPYKVFYRVTNQTIEILYIHHSSRDA
ncbi:type II toxin-antitoxin system RelE/ParE family toxin [Bradyrhizobium sp. AUGA SZCCT0177]|uniref:type II toxin-antitoxin system RelE/ParE family toxin n=1 Tax=Bradyrhizobium sp. AUGA SZCCT0177 TaxID=2807665 RepID=UPI001BA74113|nr:type II toxin-antitoxin system RelE/ParE family toxin [Bradyrhizobium sp. AUGA SZCCT0177]MBR1283950.1 type II toxin-antitoxin system RelE/ParE family toxin [Bradyrhizobium sp. AUGA SZCCT0177]